MTGNLTGSKKQVWGVLGGPPGKIACAERAVVVATALLLASLLVRTFHDSDVWWQVAIGRDILDHLALPHGDRFAAAAVGRPYHDSHWLFQVLLAFADRIGGIGAVGATFIPIWAGTLVYCYRSLRLHGSAVASPLLLVAVALSANARFMPRPDIVTCLFIAIFGWLLYCGRYRSKRELALFFVLQAIWSNAHGLFVIGPFMAGCYLFGALVGRGEGVEAERMPLVRLCCLLLVATLCTPFPVAGWQYAFRLASEAGPAAHPIFNNLFELQPTFGPKVVGRLEWWAFVLIGAGWAGSSLLRMLRRDLHLGRTAIALAMLVVAVGAQRNMPLFTLSAAPLIAENLRGHLPKATPSALAKAALAALLLASCWLPVSGRYYEWFGYTPVRFGLGAPEDTIPARFPEFLRSISFSGQIYNDDTFGGFCLYHGILPLVDGRWEVYDIDKLSRILKAPYDAASWDWVLANYGISGVLLTNGSDETKALLPRLLRDGRFQMVYGDEVSTFLLRVN